MAVHVVGGRGFLPRGDEPLVVDGTNLVDTAQGSVGLYAAGVVVRVEYPLEVAADTDAVVVCFLGQASLGFEQTGERLLTVFGITMQVERAPGPVFAIQQLFGLTEFLVVVVGRAAIRAAPVLDDVPVGALAAVAGGDGTLVAAGGVKAANDVATLLGKCLGQHALVLQSPEYQRRGVATLLDPAHQEALEGVAELGGVVPDMGRELAPEQDALLVEQLLVEQVVGLVSLAEGVEAGVAYLLDARTNLFGREGMALAQQVFVLAGAVDEDRRAVEVEAMVGRC